MKIFADLQTMEDQLEMLEEKAGPSSVFGGDDYTAVVSHMNTYTFVMSTNDVEAARDAIRRSELRHHTSVYRAGDHGYAPDYILNTLSCQIYW